MSFLPTGPADAAPEPPAPPHAADLRLVVPEDAAAAAGEDTFDAWVLAIAQHQDRQALARLFAHFAPRLKSWLVRTGSEPALADDLVQDSFVLLWRKAAQFDPAQARVAAWLFTIARNLRVDRRRGVSESWLSLDKAEADQIPDAVPGVDARLQAAQSEGVVRRALTRLTSDQRTLVQLSFYEDKSHSSIASEMQLPLGTVKTRLRAAAARLRQLLEEERP
jgi:RNA polymerase sigma-70 factor (ECF subfamily)